MKTIETLKSANEVKNEESQCVYVLDGKAQVWFDGEFFCARKNGINIIKRKTFNAILNCIYKY